MKKVSLLADEAIVNKILILRDQKVMVDRDLAELYGVETRILNQAVKRNEKRFPEDFMFQMTNEEFSIWKSQIVMSNNSCSQEKKPRPRLRWRFVGVQHGSLPTALENLKVYSKNTANGLRSSSQWLLILPPGRRLHVGEKERVC